MKRLAYFCSLAAILLLVSGCGTKTSSIVQSTELPKQPSFSEFIRHIQLPDYLRITFESEADPSLQTARIYTAKDYQFNQEIVIRSIMHGQITESFEYAEGPGYKSQNGPVEEYLNFYTKAVKGGFVYGLSMGGDFLSRKLSEVINAVPGPSVPNSMDASKNKFDFLAVKDLTFMNDQEATATLLSYITKIGFPDIAISESYALDIKTILDHDAKRKICDSGNKETDHTEREFTWSVEDECYLFFLQQMIGDIPMINEPWEAPSTSLSPAGNWMPDTLVSAYLSKQGIIRLKASGLYAVLSEGPEEILLNAGEATRILIDSLSGLKRNNPTEIYAIKLCYVAIPGEGQYEIKPVWCFSIHETVTVTIPGKTEQTSQYQKNWLFIIDAIEGEVLSA